MSKDYDLYLKKHIEAVGKGFYWLKEHLPQIFDTYDENELNKLTEQICEQHDSSKFEGFEYDAYDKYFYGKNRSYEVVQEFNYAWLEHLHCNKHHWQYWVLTNDDHELGEIILDMPYCYIIEMICDWWAFSWNKGDLMEIFNWYADHAKYIKLSKYTRKTVEAILQNIREKLEKDAVVKIEGSED